MSRKLLLTTFFITVLIGTLGLSFEVQRAEASGTIYIRAEGSVDPLGAPISTVDNVTYTLTGNITSDADGIVVERSNVVVDGAGHTVQGAETGTGFSLAADNVTVRNACVQKFRYGIVISSSGCTVINNVITYNVKWGVYLGGSNNRIISNRIADTGLNLVGYDIVGVYCGYGSDNNTIIDNHIEKNGYVGSGILLYGSSDNTITGNNITNHDYAGIYLDTSSGNIIYHNNFINNYYQVSGYYSANTWDSGYPSGGNYWSNYAGVDLKSGFYQNETGSDGIGDAPYVIYADNQDNYPLMHPWSPLSVHNINTGFGYGTIQEAINANETLSGHTIFVEAGTYYENVLVNKTVSLVGESRENTLVDGGGTGSVISITANNVVIDGFTLSSSGSDAVFEHSCGVYVDEVLNVTIKNNEITDNKHGIGFWESSNGVVSGNDVSNNVDGIYLWYSSDNMISGNNITSHTIYDGIYLSESSSNVVSGNNIASNGYGIHLYESSNCTVSGNNIANNMYGIYLGWDSSNNVFSENLVTNNSWGIDFYSSSNMVFHNNFINNVNRTDSPYLNVWDNGYPSGGNYWSDYNGVDVKSGSYQNETGSDGIGDTPYIINANNIDNYPLMMPYAIPEFPSFLILLLFMIATLLAVIIYRMKHALTVNRG